MRFVSLLKICNKYLEELDQVVGVEEFAELLPGSVVHSAKFLEADLIVFVGIQLLEHLF